MDEGAAGLAAPAAPRGLSMDRDWARPARPGRGRALPPPAIRGYHFIPRLRRRVRIPPASVVSAASGGPRGSLRSANPQSPGSPLARQPASLSTFSTGFKPDRAHPQRLPGPVRQPRPQRVSQGVCRDAVGTAGLTPAPAPGTRSSSKSRNGRTHCLPWRIRGDAQPAHRYLREAAVIKGGCPSRHRP